jgi:hypothetical protein
MYRVRGKWLANVRRMYRVRPIFQNGHFGEYSNSPKLANFWRVLEFDKFAGEWPLLKYLPKDHCKVSSPLYNVTSVLILACQNKFDLQWFDHKRFSRLLCKEESYISKFGTNKSYARPKSVSF